MFSPGSCRTKPLTIHPLSLPKIFNFGFGEIEGLFDRRRKVRKERKRLAREWEKERERIEAELKAREEHLKQKWEREIKARQESEILEAIKSTEQRPPVYSWEEIVYHMGTTGSNIIHPLF